MMESVVLVISDRVDPWQNLALENELFRRQEESKSYLFLYKNRPCVVIGRFQNPFREANMLFLEQSQIPIVRRQSGGGSVYHDLGNLNLSFIHSDEKYHKKNFLNKIASVLNNQDLNCYVNDRHDLFIKDKKISGSAFKQSKQRMIHHFTLLIESNLTQLRKSLKFSLGKFETRALASHPSSVTNIKDEQPLFCEKKFIEDLKSSLDLVEIETINWQTIINSTFYEQAKAWENNIGLTPDFTWYLNDEIFLKVIKGHIEEFGFLAHLEKQKMSMSLLYEELKKKAPQICEALDLYK